MDTSVNPGDDFDKYANGKWEKSAQIPPDKSNISVFSMINDEAQKREAALIDDIVKSNPAAGSDEARIANFYNAYMDTAAIEKLGLSPIKPDIDRIEAIADKGALAEAIGHTLRADTDPLNATNFHTENLFGIFVTQGFNDPTKTVPYMLQGGLGLPDRDYYVSSDPAMAKLRADYTPYVAKILTLAGLPERAGARAEDRRARDQDRAGARDAGSEPVGREGEQSLDPRRLRQEGAGDRLGPPARRRTARNQQDFIIWQPSAVTKEAALVGSEPLDVWKDWLAFHRINQMTSVLPKAFDDAHFAFYGTEINGTAAAADPRQARARPRSTPGSAMRSASATSTATSRPRRRPTSTAW